MFTVTIFHIIFDSLLFVSLPNTWKWAKNGPKMATVNNPIKWEQVGRPPSLNMVRSPLLSSRHPDAGHPMPSSFTSERIPPSFKVSYVPSLILLPVLLHPFFFHFSLSFFLSFCLFLISLFLLEVPQTSSYRSFFLSGSSSKKKKKKFTFVALPVCEIKFFRRLSRQISR